VALKEIHYEEGDLRSVVHMENMNEI